MQDSAGEAFAHVVKWLCKVLLQGLPFLMEQYPGSHLLLLQPFQDHKPALERWQHMSTGFKRKADNLIEALLLPSARFTFQRNPIVLVHERLGIWAKGVDLNKLTTEQAICNSIQGFWNDTNVPSTTAITMV